MFLFTNYTHAQNFSVNTSSELEECFKNEAFQTCVLNSNINALKSVSVTTNKELNLNGHTLTSDLKNEPFIFVDGPNANLTINDTENGQIVNNTGYGIYVLNDGTLNVNGGTIESLYAPLSGNNTTGKSNYYINKGTLHAKEGPAIYMPNQGFLEINDGFINGGISARMGQIIINGGIISNKNKVNIDTIEDYYNHSGIIFFKDAISIINGTYKFVDKLNNSLNLTINGGTIESSLGSALTIYNLGKVEQDANITINGGNFIGYNEAITSRKVYLEDFLKDNQEYSANNNNALISIQGGTFNSSIATYLNNKYIENKDNDKYIVSENKTLINELGYITSNNLFNNNYKLNISIIKINEEEILTAAKNRLNELLESDKTIKDIKTLSNYNIAITADNQEIQNEDNYTIALNINPELLNNYKYFKVLVLNENGISNILDANQQDNYLIFNTATLGKYSLIGYNTSTILPTNMVNKLEEENPNTFDDASFYLLLGIISIIGIVSTGIYITRKN